MGGGVIPIPTQEPFAAEHTGARYTAPEYGVRELLADVARYRARGAPKKLLDRFVAEETGGRYTTVAKLERDAKLGVVNLGRAAAMGASAGFLDEIVGALQARGGNPISTTPDPTQYAAGQESILRPYETFRGAHPIPSGAAELAGGLLTPYAAGARPVAAGSGILRSAARGATVGAAYGGLSGLGYAPPGSSPAELAARAGLGVAAGGGIGGAGAGLTDLALAVTRGGGGRRLADAIARSGGEPAVLAAGGRMGAAGRGGESVLADLSPQLREAADFAVTQDPAARAQFMPGIMQRGAGAPERLLNDVGDVLGGVPNAGARKDVLDATRRMIENSPTTGYAALDATVKQVSDPRLADFLRRPIVRRAFERAKEEGMLAGGERIEPSFRALNSLRKQLNAQAQSHWSNPGGNKDLAAALSSAATELGGILRDNVPGFASLQAQVGGVLRETGALERAAEFTGRADVRELQRVFSAMDAGEREQFRYALASQLADELNAKATNRSAAQSYLFASKNVEARLRIAFGSDANFARWMERVRAERAMEETAGVFGGSATARRLAASGEPNVQGVLSPIGGARRAALAIGTRAHRLRTAGQMAPLLFGGGALDDILAQIRALAARQSGGAGSQVLAPAGAGLLLGRQ